MRNKYKGTCYRCNKLVDVGEGHFEMHSNGKKSHGGYSTLVALFCTEN